MIVDVRGRVRITVVYRHLLVDGLPYSGKCSTETASTEESVMSPARTKYVSRVRAVVGGLLLHAFMVDQGGILTDLVLIHYMCRGKVTLYCPIFVEGGGL